MRFVWWMALRWTGLRNLPPRRLWPQRRLKYPKKAMLSGVIPPREALVTLVVIVVFLVAQKVRLPTLGEATPSHPTTVSNSILRRAAKKEISLSTTVS